jgi:pilus assembly protein Flp/PilA
MRKIYTATMNKLSAVAKKFAKGDEGASLVEYGLLVGLIACVCIAAITTLGTTINSFFGSINSALSGVTIGGGS